MGLLEDIYIYIYIYRLHRAFILFLQGFVAFSISRFGFFGWVWGFSRVLGA